jgi:hypothetical protein
MLVEGWRVDASRECFRCSLENLAASRLKILPDSSLLYILWLKFPMEVDVASFKERTE